MHREKIHASLVNSCIASQYFCIVRRFHTSQIIHASREDSIPRRKFMHREKISCLAKNSCIASSYSCIESQFMHWELIFMHCESIFLHREKISYLADNLCITRRFHISQKIHASREDFMPRRKFMHCVSCIESQFMHRELIHALRVNIHASRINIHALRENIIRRRNPRYTLILY